MQVVRRRAPVEAHCERAVGERKQGSKRGGSRCGHRHRTGQRTSIGYRYVYTGKGREKRASEREHDADDLPAPVTAASATIVMPTVSLSWTMSAAKTTAAAVTTAVTMTAAAAGHVRRRRGAMARGGRGNRERAQERAREESVRAGRQEGEGELWRSLCTLQWKGRGWDGACAAYVSVRAAEKRARLKKARTW